MMYITITKLRDISNLKVTIDANAEEGEEKFDIHFSPADVYISLKKEEAIKLADLLNFALSDNDLTTQKI